MGVGSRCVQPVIRESKHCEEARLLSRFAWRTAPEDPHFWNFRSHRFCRARLGVASRRTTVKSVTTSTRTRLGLVLLVGLHVSIAGSLDQAVARARGIGCTTFQIFTRNPRGWKFKALQADEVMKFKEAARQEGYEQIVAHMPYLPNLASPTEQLYKLSRETLIAELQRCGQLGIPYLVTHLGSHLGKGKAVGAKRIIEACNEALARTDNKTQLLLENTAGQKNSMGSAFEDLRYLLDGIEPKDRSAVCFDTCHAFAAGFDLRTEKTVGGTVKLLDETVGVEQIKVLHVNDSKGGLGSGSDRHEHIGLGKIGSRGFRAILAVKEFRSLPIILETPIDDRRNDIQNLKKVRELANG